MKAIKVILYIVGVLLLLQALAIFLPLATINSILGIFGQVSFPDNALAQYGMKVILLTYFWIGLGVLMVVANAEKYRPIIVIMGWGFLTGGILCLIVGMIYEMPPLYYIGDFLFAIIVGILFLVYKPKKKALES